MPRRNRNAGTPRLDADRLAAELAELATYLRCTARTSTGKSGLSAWNLASVATPGSLVVVTDGKQQPIPYLVLESR